jgi:hypothetical protein
MENNENSAGPIIGLVIILALIILGGLYFWNERGDMNPAGTVPNTASTNESITASIEAQSNSDEIDSIQADLDSTETDSLDSELQAS